MTDIEELEKKVEEKKKQDLSLAKTEHQEQSTKSIAHDSIVAQYNQHSQNLANNEKFQQATQKVVEESAEAELKADALKILDQKQKNELAEYTLHCEKQKLEYRKKMEKGLIKEQIKSDVAKKKIETLKTRYGYLYEQDANGQPKDFVANKFVNGYKEFCNWYKGTGDGFKKFVGTTLKILMWGTIAFLVITFGYKAIEWLSNLQLK